MFVYGTGMGEAKLTSMASKGHWATQIMQPMHAKGTGSG
jgi:hypothetical protein